MGGEDRKSGEANDADQRFARLESWARELIRGLGRVTHRWSGQVLDTIDYVIMPASSASSLAASASTSRWATRVKG
ncbi:MULTISPECIES: hypothetical protein [unclassified Bradyrhizobium]|jgi:hypothetical protein|uniref:hypothetical protein n=1 Tax=unclassified Bradyrhizobium TaxID=2631580 RepID=UPI003391AA12